MYIKDDMNNDVINIIRKGLYYVLLDLFKGTYLFWLKFILDKEVPFLFKI